MEEKTRYNEEEILCIYDLSNEPKQPNFYSAHTHSAYEMLFLYDGEAEYTVEDRVYPLQKNDLLLIPPAVCHSLQVHPSSSYERILLYFRESVILEELLPFLQGAEPLFRVQPSSPIKRALDNLRDCSSIFDEKAFDYLSRTTVNHILLNLRHLALLSKKEKDSANAVLKKILVYIDENPTLPLTVTQLSEEFSLSPSWIAHSFTQKLGVSPLQYVNRKKIAYAQSLIAAGKHPVEAAEACGYVNYTTFFRQYKKYLGIPPSEEIKK